MKKIQILQYLGIFNNFAVALFSFEVNGKKYEGTITYDDKQYDFTVDEEFISDLGVNFKYHPDYHQFSKKMIYDLRTYSDLCSDEKIIKHD